MTAEFRQRSYLVRVPFVVAVVGGVTLGWLALLHLVAEQHSSGPVGDVLDLVFPAILPGIVTGLLASKVSYRWRDGLWWAAPIIGTYLLIKFAWRASMLPYRDWPPRRDEPAQREARGVPSAHGRPIWTRK